MGYMRRSLVQRLQYREEAWSIKKEANTLYNQGDYDRALNEYEEALRVCPNEFHEEQAILYANVAACQLKLEDYLDAVESCSDALALNPAYTKARFRRAQAWEHIGTASTLADAVGDYRILCETVEENPAKQKLWVEKMHLAQTRLDQVREREKEQMLGQLKNLGNSLLGRVGMSLDDFQSVQDPVTKQTSFQFRPRW
ncbi:hypothetical protein IWQ61_006714 [Dispira simplex]|nr:hypothetical protein IWQ61_006714 [Dispira simplex]